MQSSAYPFITPSSTCLSEDLLFFDTFSHYGSEKDNFDLVQFPSPVVIDLIKIVPLGQPIEAKIPGNVRLGATNPSNCELEFFINDLTKQDAHTMTDLGKFYCSEKETDFSPPLQIQTDGLLLRGSYRTLTLAIFGQIATYDEKVEDDTAILSAASPPAQTPASPVASERDLPYIVRSVDHELLSRVRESSESLDESTMKSNELIKHNLMIESNDDMIDDAMMDDLIETNSNIIKDEAAIEELSSSDGPTSATFNLGDKRQEDIDYSNSTDLENNHYANRSSKENLDNLIINNDNNNNEDENSRDEDSCIQQEIREWMFNVETYNPKPLLYFPDPSLTLQERSVIANKLKLDDSEFKISVDKEVEKVREMFSAFNYPENSKSDEWVTLLEDLTNDIANMSLGQTIGNDEMLKFLIEQVCHGLDLDLALRQKQTGFKVRHLRAGIKLATVLFHCGELVVKALLESEIPQKVLQLYDKDQMSLPLKLLIFRCLNAACDSVNGTNHIIKHSYHWGNNKISTINIRKGILELEKNNGNKIVERDESHAKFESISSAEETKSRQDKNELQEQEKLITSLFKYNPSKSSIEIEDEDDRNNNGISNSHLTCYQYMILILLTQPTTRVTIAIGNLIKKIRLYECFYKLSLIQFDEFQDSEDGVFDSTDDKKNKACEQLDESLQIIQNIVNLTENNCVNIAQPVRYLPAKIQFQVKQNSSDTFLAVFKWLKHFKTLEHFNNLFNLLQNNTFDHTSSYKIEQSIKIQDLCLSFIKQLLDSPRGIQLFLSGNYCETTKNLIKSLSLIKPPKRLSNLRTADGIENCLSKSLCREESLLASSCNDLSLKMCYNFKIFSCIDKLFHFHRELISKREESALCDPEKVLHQLYIMADHPYGLNAIIKHFSIIGNLDCLLRFLDMPEHHKQLEFVKETSIDYALELVGTFFRLNSNVLEIADEYLETLIDLCKNKDKNLSIRIKSLLPWLTPFDTDKSLPLITYSDETFRQLTRIIRKCIPNYSIPFANGLDFELPPHMITAVRILRQLCIPPQVENFINSNFDSFSIQKLIDHNPNSSPLMLFVERQLHEQNQNQFWNLNLRYNRNDGSDSLSMNSLNEQLAQISNTFKLFQPYDETICGDLKYHYGVMQTFEQEGLKRLLNTLKELAGNYPRPIYQSAALSGFRGRIVLSYINSVIILLHSIVCHLIDARGSEFKDTTIISVVLETYSLLCFVPKPSENNNPKENDFTVHNNDIGSLQKSITLLSDNYQLAQQTRNLILSILMSYTQMCLSVSESEEKVISKSMWTKMLKEVIDFTLSTPVFFHHGLDVLTKILPQPLPCSTMVDSIDQEQLFRNVNHRKLWSAHLHPLHQQIEQMISHLSISYQPNIRTLLYYLCNQLCDLSSNAACMVAKTITDNLINYTTKLIGKTNGNNSPQDSVVVNQNAQNVQPIDSLDSKNKNYVTTSTCSTKGSSYAVRMILNLLKNLITNQAFETAFSNQLQVLGKKDEKLLINIQQILKLNDDSKSSDLNMDDSLITTATGNNSFINAVNQLIEFIKSTNNKSKDGLISTNLDNIPPDELSKINLLEVARKTSDRFSISSGLKQTYRLKVLLDLNSHAHRPSDLTSKRFDHTPYNYQELSFQSAHKSYVQPIRGRGRSLARPDLFRLRPQNTSRPPSIHVDDFIDLYGDNSGASSSSSRYKSNNKISIADYRSGNRGFIDQGLSLHNEPHRQHSTSFFNSQLGGLPPQSPYNSTGSISSRSQQISRFIKNKDR